jgi:hypothetical protein
MNMVHGYDIAKTMDEPERKQTVFGLHTTGSDNLIAPNLGFSIKIKFSFFSVHVPCQLQAVAECFQQDVTS